MKNKTFTRLSVAVAGSTLAASLIGVGAVSAAESKATTAERPVRFELTEEQRAKLDQAKTLRQEGKMEEARALIESSGLFDKLPRFNRERPFKMKFHHPNHEQMKAALSNNDFAAFKELTKDTPFAEKLDEALFAKMVEAHKLREAGDHEGAMKIMKEIMPERVRIHDGEFKHGFRLRGDVQPASL